MNYEDMTDAELEQHASAIEAVREIRRREEQRVAERERIEQMITAYQLGLNRCGGDQWVRPETVMDSYPHGAVVTHGGLWSSLIRMNMAEPGTDPEAWEPADGGDDAA